MVTLPDRGRGPSYEKLVSGLREKPTFAVAEDVIKKDYKLKLPDRRFIQLLNTPEISQFRGYQEDLDENEKHRDQHEREKIELREAARDAGNGLGPDLHIVHDLLSQHRQQQTAMREHMESLSAINQRQLEGIRAEQQAQLDRLAAEQMAAANRSAMAEQALLGLRDVALEHRNAIGRLAESQGVVHQHFDQSSTSTTVVHQNVDVEIHNQMMNMMHTHAQQFGQYMQQQRMSSEEFQRLLYTHLMRQRNPAVINILRPPDQIVQVTGGGGPPPPPPDGGRIKVKKPGKKKGPTDITVTYGTDPPPQPLAPYGVGPPPPPPPPPPAPAPVPVPTIPSGVPVYRMDTPQPPTRRGRSRTPQARAPRTPSRVPWNSGGEDPPAMPAARPRGRPPKRASEEAAIEAPVAVRPASRSRSASVAAVAEERPKRERSASVATVAYDADTLRPAPKKRGRPAKSPARSVILPTEEDAIEHEKEMQEVQRRGKEIALQARVVANMQKYARPKAKAKAKPRPVMIAAEAGPSVPSAAPPVKQVRIKKVTIQSSPKALVAEKRGRGRPKGAVGKKKRDALVEAETRKVMMVQSEPSSSR